MAKKPNPKPQVVLYDVHYQDGSQLSNRRIPAELLDELDREAAILSYLEKQDREIAERSGRPRGPIKTVVRSQ